MSERFARGPTGVGLIEMTDADNGEASRRPHQAIDRISHELRTPLTVVIGMCELLHNDLTNDDALKELSSRLAANAWLLHTVVERLINELYQSGYTGPDSAEPTRPDNISRIPDPESPLPRPRNR